MSTRMGQLALALTVVAALAVPALGDPISLELYPFTGEIRLANPTATPVSISFYSLSTSSAAFNGSPAVWKSIANNYDVSGNGFVDPVNNWTIFANSSTMLTEAVFNSPAGSLAPFRAISLGKVWNGTTSIMAQALDDNSQFATVNQRVAIDGDYDQDGVVDGADYLVWKSHYGESGTLDALKADGNLDGTVDAADYTVWRNNAGLDLATIGFGSSAGGESTGGAVIGSVVPEPTGTLLALLAVVTISARRRRRFQSAGGR